VLSTGPSQAMNKMNPAAIAASVLTNRVIAAHPLTEPAAYAFFRVYVRLAIDYFNCIYGADLEAITASSANGAVNSEECFSKYNGGKNQ